MKLLILLVTYGLQGIILADKTTPNPRYGDPQRPTPRFGEFWRHLVGCPEIQPSTSCIRNPSESDDVLETREENEISTEDSDDLCQNGFWASDSTSNSGSVSCDPQKPLPSFEQLRRDLVECREVQPSCELPQTSGGGSLSIRNEIPMTQEENVESSEAYSYLCQAGPSWDPGPTSRPGADFYSGSIDLEQSQDHQKFFCKLCRESYDRENDLKEHLETHSNEKRLYSCEHCGKCCKSRSGMTWHTNNHGYFACEQCGEISHDKPSSKCHRTKDSKKIFACKFCGKKFERKNHMEIHERIHTEEKPFSCEICAREFESKTNLKRHMKTHSDERPFSCVLCPASFKYRKSLAKHAQTHARYFSCEVCAATFRYNSRLKFHMRTHSKDWPFICEQCSRCFKFKKHLEKHARWHTGEAFSDDYECSERDIHGQSDATHEFRIDAQNSGSNQGEMSSHLMRAELETTGECSYLRAEMAENSHGFNQPAEEDLNSQMEAHETPIDPNNLIEVMRIALERVREYSRDEHDALFEQVGYTTEQPRWQVSGQ